MSFLHPGLLLLLIVPAALLLWTWRRRGQQVVLPFDHGLPGDGLPWRIALELAESLPALLLAVAIVLLAGPQRAGKPVSKRKLTNIELCLDISRSMGASLGEGSRYDAAMKATEEFVDFRKGDAVGLTFFGNNVLHWVPLTSDPSAIKCAPPFMRPGKVPPWFNGTEIARALRACKQVLVERQDGDRLIVLVSDGESGDLLGNAEALARELKEARITVFAIIIGVPIQAEVRTIARATGGEAFEVGDPEALRAMFRRIDEMSQAPLEKQLPDMQDDFRPWCLVGLVLLGLASMAALGMRYVPW
jgi:Ca-activated chloride channel family protein